jgi:hypothetical protein
LSWSPLLKSSKVVIFNDQDREDKVLSSRVSDNNQQR